MISRMRLTSQAQKLITSGIIDSKVRARLSFEEIRAGLRHDHHRMSDGKVLLCPTES
jgi:hypothetical protein